MSWVDPLSFPLHLPPDQSNACTEYAAWAKQPAHASNLLPLSWASPKCKHEERRRQKPLKVGWSWLWNRLRSGFWPSINLTPGMIGANSSPESAPPVELVPKPIKFGFLTSNLVIPHTNINIMNMNSSKMEPIPLVESILGRNLLRFRLPWVLKWFWKMWNRPTLNTDTVVNSSWRVDVAPASDLPFGKQHIQDRHLIGQVVSAEGRIGDTT